MISWVKDGNGRFVAAGLIVLMLGFGYLAVAAEESAENERFDPEAFRQLQGELADDPYDGPLLLRTARHGVEMIRHHRRDPEMNLEDPRGVLLTSLEAYRRLDSSPRWNFSARDQFNAAYLYHQLGQLDPDFNYLPRARDIALQSYERGYRSEELTTLLGNLHVELGEHERALDFYRSLGTSVNDPVILFNKAWTHRSLGNPERANELLVRVYDMVQEQPDRYGELLWNVREASLALRLDQENHEQVLAVLRDHPEWLERPSMQVLKARALIQGGRTDHARQQLEELIDVEPVARTARLLLENLDETT